MKTPEQMAEEFANDWHKDCDYPEAILKHTKKATETVFLAGYQAAKNHYTGKDQPETLGEIASSFARQKAEKFYQEFLRGKRR